MFSQNSEAVAVLAPKVIDFVDALEEFWGRALRPCQYHLQDLNGSKAVYGGDLFPSARKNIASSVGLFADTIVLSDPFVQTSHVFRRSSPEQQTFYLVKHAVNLLRYQELAAAHLDTPIVVICPYSSSIDPEDANHVQRSGEADALSHAGYIFGRQFDSLGHLLEFVEKFDTPAKLEAAISSPERLLFDVDWRGTPEHIIKRAMEDDFGKLSGIQHPGKLAVAHGFSRILQATDVLFKSRFLLGTPLIDAPTSWKYFNWKLQYNAAHDPVDQTSLHMLRGFQHAAKTDEEWLGNIPPKSLIEMRKVGAFEDVRTMLAQGIEELADAAPENYFRTSDRIVDNIRSGYARHKTEVRRLRRQGLRFAGVELGPMIFAGSLDVASAIAGTPTFGLASIAINQIVDAPKLKDIPARFLEIRNAHRELRKTPVGLFFRHRK